ncbi:MAG: hypothetical protein WD431_25460, partial [Cyclobacteriaceae bacterium]
KGDEGPQGIEGPKGNDGIDGKDGIDGTNGIDGIDGTDGIDGKDGKDGVDGKDGNANVKMHRFNGPYTFSSSATKFVYINMTKKEFDQTIFLCYISYKNLWVSMPGPGFPSASPYRVLITHLNNLDRSRIGIQRLAPYIPVDKYDEIKVITIEATPGNRIQLNDINLTDYEEVVKHFGF